MRRCPVAGEGAARGEGRAAARATSVRAASARNGRAPTASTPRRDPVIDHLWTPRIFSAGQSSSPNDRRSRTRGASAHLPAQNSQDCKVVTRPAKTCTGRLSPGRAAVPMALWEPCQRAFSVRARSRGPRSTRRCVCSERPHSFAFSAAAGVPVHASSVGGRGGPLRKGGWHATPWRPPWSPRACSAVLGATPISPERASSRQVRLRGVGGYFARARTHENCSMSF